jgi:hypothetical protein
MSCFLFTEDNDNVRKINIDELYEKKKQRDLRQLSVFNKILNRINKRILTTSQTKRDETYIWYQVPPYIFGEPIYDQTDCIGYVVTKLAENGFFVKYINPGTLFISWENWVPTYARQEIRKKTGYVLDENGNIIDRVDPKDKGGRDDENGFLGKEVPSNDPRRIQIGNPDTVSAQTKDGKKYTPIAQYKPTGSLIYGDALEKLEKRVTFK